MNGFSFLGCESYPLSWLLIKFCHCSGSPRRQLEQTLYSASIAASRVLPPEDKAKRSRLRQDSTVITQQLFWVTEAQQVTIAQELSG